MQKFLKLQGQIQNNLIKFQQSALKSNTSQLTKNNFYQQFSTVSIRDKIKQERLDRLKREKDYFPTKTQEDSHKIRNVGIIAHIDAGKTTTTERMLYYAGALNAPGEVHDGNTVMDYMDQERQRGITIRSAAISFNWKGHQLNLLDTPGHIDFTGEVERALRILDGAVAIFDAVSGVQTQSEMVWYQSNKFNIPRIAFINKMDRAGANLESTLQSIKNRLNIDPLVLQIPIGEGDQFKGIIDIISMLEIRYEDQYGNNVTINPVNKDAKYYQSALQYREQLLDTLSLYDEEITDKILDGEEIPSEFIEKTIKKVVGLNSKNVCPVLVGSSLKNKGIQLLMDAILKYLPSPSTEKQLVSIKNEQLIRTQKNTEKLTALAYKIINDPAKGPLTYVRVYSGILNARSNFKNISRDIIEKGQMLYRVRANDYVSIKEIGAGDIAAISGFKHCQAGDTLLEENDLEDFVLEKLEMPQPVFMAAIEYQSLKDKALLESALATIAREDSSFQFKEDQETGQLIGSGLGELHLEIIRDRIESEFKVNATLGKMRVSYREGIQDSFQLSYTFEKLIANKPIYIDLELGIEPIEQGEEIEEEDADQHTNKHNNTNIQNNEILMEFERDPEFDMYYKEFKRRQAVLERSKSSIGNKQPIQEEPENHTLTPAQKKLQNFRFIKNPIKHTEIDKLKDEYGEESLYHISSMSFELLYSIERTIRNGFSKGNLLSYPLVGVRVKVLDGKYTNKRTNEIATEQATAEMMVELVDNASPILLEPIMDVEVSTPQATQKEVMNDIIKGRRGKVIQINEETSKFGQAVSDRYQIESEVPLIETVGYSSYLRSISKGEASFIMKFKKFDYVGGQKQKELLEGSKFF